MNLVKYAFVLTLAAGAVAGCSGAPSSPSDETSKHEEASKPPVPGTDTIKPKDCWDDWGCAMDMSGLVGTCTASSSSYTYPSFVTCGTVSISCQVWCTDFVRSDCSTSTRCSDDCSCPSQSI